MNWDKLKGFTDGIGYKRVLVLLGCLTLGVIGVGTVSWFFRTTNCGGNSAALARVREYALLARVGAADSSNRTFQISMVTQEQREQLGRLARYHWIPEARFLVSTAPLVDPESQPRRVIVVCDTPYKNVPRRWVGSAPLAYAVGFSDGSASLISPADFAALDRSSFKFLDDLYPTK